jgi:hypothetical protein
MADPTLKLVPGRQLWLVSRTDRDGASAEEIANMVRGFLQFTFRDVEGGQPGSSPQELLATGDHEWRVSAARPVRLIGKPVPTVAEVAPILSEYLLSQSTPGGLAKMQTIATREELDPLPILVAERPWYLVLEVWWRGAEAVIPWPCLQVTWAGTRQRDYEEADWLLLKSFVPPGEVTDPGDATWGEAQTENATEAGEAIVKAIRAPMLLAAGFVALVGGMYLVARASRRR